MASRARGPVQHCALSRQEAGLGAQTTHNSAAAFEGLIQVGAGMGWPLATTKPLGYLAGTCRHLWDKLGRRRAGFLSRLCSHRQWPEGRAHPLRGLPPGALTVEQLLLVALGLVFPGTATWGMVKAGRLPASLWAPWLLNSSAHGCPGGRMVSP